jgi:uncharacterized protein (DUF302 family)
MGVMLPCNVVVQEHENGEVEVSALNPLENIEKAFSTTQLRELAAEVGNRLRTAIDDLHRDVCGEQESSKNMRGPIQG